MIFVRMLISGIIGTFVFASDVHAGTVLIYTLDAKINPPEDDYSFLLQQWSHYLFVKDSHAKMRKLTSSKSFGCPHRSVSLKGMNASISKDVEGFRWSRLTPSRDQEVDILVVAGDYKDFQIYSDRLPGQEVDHHARKRGSRSWAQRNPIVGRVYLLDRFVRSANDVVKDVVC